MISPIFSFGMNSQRNDCLHSCWNITKNFLKESFEEDSNKMASGCLFRPEFFYECLGMMQGGDCK